MNYEEVIKLPLRVKISKFKEKNLRIKLIENTNFLPESTSISNN